MIHYHGTPISPIKAIETMGGKHFCVSYARPDDLKRVQRDAMGPTRQSIY